MVTITMIVIVIVPSRALVRLAGQSGSEVSRDNLSGPVVERLPLAQGVILETRDGVPHRAPCMEPAFPSACVSASLCVSLMNK